MTSPSVYLVEDDEGSRDSTVCLFNVHGIKTKCFQSAEQFLTEQIECPVGSIVTDLVLPGMSGLEMFQKTRDKGWTTPAIVLTAFGDVPSVVQAFRYGIYDFLQKPISAESLIRSVKECFAFTQTMQESEVSTSETLFRLNRLSKREREVLNRLGQGKAMKEIAKEFGISFQSVSSARKRLLRKLDIGGDVLLARWILTHKVLLDEH